MTEKIEPVLRVTYAVIAYDCSGYGCDMSKDFCSGEDAIHYARSLEDRFMAQVIKRITMEPINQKIYDYTDK